MEDRAADTWEPLVAVADSAGRDWGRVARAAAIQFTYDAEVDEGQSRELMLLSDVRRIFDELDAPFVATVDMLEYLSIVDDAPWSDLTAKALGQRMSTFGIRASHSFDRKQRGYRKNDFADAFEGYLPDREA